MTVRNILDWQGNIVGELELPDETPEEVWAEKLAAYSQPPAKSMDQLIVNAVMDGRIFGRNLLDIISKDNKMAGITEEGVQEVIENYKEVIIMLLTGAIPSSLTYLKNMEATELFTEERLKKYSEMIRVYLKLPVSEGRQ